MSSSKVYVITGGTGGMGIATAKRLGDKGTLLLADVSEKRLATVKNELVVEGNTVETIVCDVTNKEEVQQLADKAKDLGTLGAIIHTAGLSPALADARKIMDVNVIGTVHILDSFLEIAEKDSVAVCIASMAGHMAPADERIDNLLDNPLDKDFLNRMDEIVKEDGQISYGISKRGVLRMIEQRVDSWGEKGARIVSISPGLIETPMGNKEAEDPEIEKKMRQINPLSRFGTPDEIAAPIEFLCSPGASYITGTDLRIDAGVTPVQQGKTK